MERRWAQVINIAILGTLAILLLNPSGVVGSWVIAGYKGWQEQRRIARNWSELVAAPSYLGAPHRPGRAAIVEFVAYDCPVCKTLAPTVLDAARAQGVSVVVRHVPSQGGGRASTEAALAAICAERYGLFPEAHDALTSEDTWLESRDWVGLGHRLGIGDPESFGDCVDEEAPARRLARDMELADILRIRGTPAFVSADGMHLGAPGLAPALAAAIATTAPTTEPTPRRLSSEHVFDSSEHPELAEQLVSVIGGFFQPDNAIILVDPTELHVVDVVSGANRVVGGKGEGPEEFSRITDAFRTSKGVGVWDVLRSRVVFVAADGEFGYSQSFINVPLRRKMFSLRPVAVRPDGHPVFRDGNGSTRERGAKGRFWVRERYVAAAPDGSLETVAEAEGTEGWAGRRVNDPVLFGHDTWEAATEERLIVAETGLQTITVYDWSGRRVGSIPMSPGVRPSHDQVRMARERRAAEWETHQELLLDFALPNSDAVNDLPDMPPDLPANEVAPALDRMQTDFESRLWVRDYRFPDQDSVLWRVWDIERERFLFTVSMDVGDELLDAQGQTVLVKRRDEFDVPRVVIVPLRS